MTTGLDALLCRPGLAVEVRANIRLQVGTATGDWAHVAAVVAAARRAGCARTALAEGLLQGVLFFGFPRAITAFEVVEREWPEPGPRAGRVRSSAQEHTDGLTLFRAIYGANATAVEAMLSRFHGELHDFVLEVAYGRILTRPELAPSWRELIAVGVLAAMDQVPQMVGHGRGALHLGATPDEVREALVTALGEVPACEEAARRILRSPR